ncbi:phosphatase PAP2 family protein [Lewinella sp. 4G2]|uniref:phosphatase PAP2 family protein n=1 Tax=Lewinella sp. 4G2 TaxID=1803372 RepID=UPI0007B45F4D|nr:phosphatase PAP2 family protein [Lewinella sp. 4G2]OAV46173.1 hypothetical protein A3850_018100 [Lewinella sp. 4G2]
MRYLSLCLLVSLLLSGASAFAQSVADTTVSPYHLSLKREAIYLGLGTLMTGGAIVFQERVPETLLGQLQIQDFGENNFLDRSLGGLEERTPARKLSDKFLNFNAGLPLALALGKRTRKDLPKIALLYTETMALTGGITGLTKVTFLRARPYVLNDNWDPQRELKSGDRASLISGHTSLSAAGTFFFARVFADYYPDSKLKPYVWVLAAGLPAATGYLRIRAAKHYPTDVLAGYAVGATVGYLVPALHKKAILPRGLRVSGGATGVYLNYRF